MDSPIKTIDEARAFFAARGCTLLSTEYNGGKTVLDYIAQCGHRNKIKARTFFKGGGNYCSHCTSRMNHLKKIPMSILREEYSAAGCTLLSTEYKGVNEKLEYICQCGHKHQMPYYCFHRGQGRKCPKCSGNQKKTIEEVAEIFTKEGCLLLSKEYKWNRQKLTYIARCGHEHTIKASAFFEGEGRLCPKCQDKINRENSRKYSEDMQRAILNDANCILLEPAKTVDDKMVYIASCGHKMAMSLYYFLAGRGRVCKNCYHKNYSIGESIIKLVLDTHHIPYKAQFPIKTKGTQRLDFFLPQYNVAIEYNGRQHYEESHFFNGLNRNSTFEYQQQRDNRKRAYCQEKGIRMIEIDGRNWSPKSMYDGLLYGYIEGLCINEGWIGI